jgi:hypothetical protein
MGYHLREIKRGEFGEISKIEEEIEELKESLEQNNRIMAMCELSDIYGAIRGYLRKYHPDLTMEDLRVMADATQRAFESGKRK